MFTYRLAARVSMLDPVRVAFKEHIRKAGTALVMNEEKVHMETKTKTRYMATLVSRLAQCDLKRETVGRRVWS